MRMSQRPTMKTATAPSALSPNATSSGCACSNQLVTLDVSMSGPFLQAAAASAEDSNYARLRSGNHDSPEGPRVQGWRKIRPMETLCDIGIIGLGVMGENLAHNLQRHGFSVCGFDLEDPKRDRFAKRTGAVAPRSLQELVASLKLPRVLLLMVPAGDAVDEVLAGLRSLLAAGDVVIDGGNTRFTDTQRRITALAGTGILFVGAGVSGGEEGALRGPSIMPGGDTQAWPVVKPMLQAIAARAEDGAPCCDWVGPGAAGHFMKMVHNGIEYADMQTICEAYHLMGALLGMRPPEMADVFAEWNRGELSSYLVG